MKGLQPRVAITIVITAGIVILGLVGALAFLANNHADASTVLGLVTTLVSTGTLVVQVITRSKVQQIQEQTNGMQTKLVDTVIQSPPLAVSQSEKE